MSGMIKRFLLFVAAAAAMCVTCCHSGGSGSTVGASSVPSARVAVAQRGDIAHVLTLAGQFQPYQVVDVHPKVSGYMKRINVDIGDIVHQGETLAVLEVPELKAELEQSGFQLKQSQEEITRAQQEIKRAEALNSALHAGSLRLQQAAATRPGLIAQQELDDAQAKDLSSQAQIDSAKSEMAAAQQHAEAARAEKERVQDLENYTTVTAPIAGVVIWRYADTGALIQGGTNSNRPGSPHRPSLAEQPASPAHARPGRRCEICSRGDQLQVRVDAINRSFTGKIVRFTRRREL
jgi:multidrug efflux pump subunit AcrA (membrane-fusion protein)